MGKTCIGCEHVTDDWKDNKAWCGYYRSWEYIDAAERCRRFEPIKSGR